MSIFHQNADKKRPGPNIDQILFLVLPLIPLLIICLLVTPSMLFLAVYSLVSISGMFMTIMLAPSVLVSKPLVPSVIASKNVSKA